MYGIMHDNELQTNIDDEDAEPAYLNSHDGDNGFFLILPMENQTHNTSPATHLPIRHAHPLR